MGANTCLFSHATSGKPTTKKIRGFLGLSAEIRNEVYKYYFESEIYCELVAKGYSFNKSKPRMVRLCAGVLPSNPHTSKRNSIVEEEAPITIRISRLLGKYNIVQGLQTNWVASIYALALICKQVHAETVVFIYRRTVFVFDAPRRINNFLSVVPKPNLKIITKLHLHINTYGSPSDLDSCRWQDKHIESWTSTCRAASRFLKGLYELAIWIQVSHSPLRFSLREKWVAPVLQFRRLGRPPGSMDSSTNPDPHSQQLRTLETVKVNISTHWSKNPLLSFQGNSELAKASEDLHLLFGRAISSAILGASEVEAMADFNTAWKVTYRDWQYHLGFGQINW